MTESHLTAPHVTIEDEARVRAILAERAAAVRNKDVGAVVALYAPDVEWFDVVDPLRQAGAHAIGERLSTWLSTFVGPFGFEVRDVHVAVGADLAASHHLTVVHAKTNQGALEMTFRVTTTYRKRDGTWLITHEHSSVPFDPATGRASLSLQP